MDKRLSPSQLDALIGPMSADLQRAAMKALSEWGYPLPGEDSFPVRLGLITRFQLWGLSHTVTRINAERLAITELAASLSAQLAEEREHRKSFDYQFTSQIELRAQSVCKMADYLVRSQEHACGVQEEISRQQYEFLHRTEKILHRLPNSKDIDRLVDLGQLASNLATRRDLNAVIIELLQVARRLEQAQAHPPAPAAPPAAPAIPVALRRASWRRRAATGLVFLTTFIVVWAQGDALSAGLIFKCTLAALLTAFCFWFYATVCEPDSST